MIGLVELCVVVPFIGHQLRGCLMATSVFCSTYKLAVHVACYYFYIKMDKIQNAT